MESKSIILDYIIFYLIVKIFLDSLVLFKEERYLFEHLVLLRF
jgi:hypothetical protein